MHLYCLAAAACIVTLAGIPLGLIVQRTDLLFVS
jgi:ABC-type proline/glycine betaine transport system permease subunit